METKRKLDFEVRNTVDLNKMLTGLLMDIRRGDVTYEIAKGITLVADKINRNNVNALDYKKITRHKRELEFFEEPEKQKGNEKNKV